MYNQDGSVSASLAAVEELSHHVKVTARLDDTRSQASFDACIFPALSDPARSHEDIRLLTIATAAVTYGGLSGTNDVPKYMLFQAAWAVVLNTYLHAENPRFAIIGQSERRIVSASFSGGTTTLDLVGQLRVTSAPEPSAHSGQAQQLPCNTALYVLDDGHPSPEPADFLKDPHSGYDIAMCFPDGESSIQEMSIFWRAPYLDRFRPDPEIVCLHDLILRHARLRPTATAIDAWNGSLTYAALDAKTSLLASYLRSLGVGPEKLVPICFERSLYSIVATIAILRAGGAWVPLEPSHPPGRWRAIISATGARIAVASKLQADRLRPLIEHLVIADEDHTTDDTVDSAQETAYTPAVPDNAACVLFTSGSTGVPKGVVHRHRDFATNIRFQNPHVQINSATRSNAHTPYSFIVSVIELWTTLAEGGCVCVPSDWDKLNDMPGSIRRLKTNWIAATPSLFTTWKQDDLRGIKTVFLAGEKQSHAIANRSGGQLSILNCYGSSEGIAHTIIKVEPDKDPAYLGPARGCVGWVVDQSDHDRLVPVGAVGELLLEGFNVAREYIGDPLQTGASFVLNPAWYSEFRKGEVSIPLLKTGDLVRYNSDGSLTLVGRKDFQVKLRGQRIEPGEVEFHLRKILPTARHIAVDLVCPANTSKPLLMAFVEPGSAVLDSQTIESMSSRPKMLWGLLLD